MKYFLTIFLLFTGILNCMEQDENLKEFVVVSPTAESKEHNKNEIELAKNDQEVKQKESAESATQNDTEHKVGFDMFAYLTMGEGQSTTPLHAAAYQENQQVILYLLQRGVSVNIKGYIGRTPLHYAAIYNKTSSTIKLLLQQGAVLEAKDANGWTPLHAACRNGKSNAVIEELVNQGADVKDLTNGKESPLVLAAYNVETNPRGAIALIEAIEKKYCTIKK